MALEASEKMGGSLVGLSDNIISANLKFQFMVDSDPRIFLFFYFKISSHCWNVHSNYKLKYKSVQKAQKGDKLLQLA